MYVCSHIVKFLVCFKNNLVEIFIVNEMIKMIKMQHISEL
jgi:hypothetical protein